MDPDLTGSREGLPRERGLSGGNTMDTLKSKCEEDVSTKQRQIAENARNLPEASFCSLAHHIDEKWLYAAYTRTRRDGAAGVDGQDGESYRAELIPNLHRLLDRFKGGSYRAPPVKRVYIPKAGSKEKRPIGIPTFEDKVLQRAVQMVLEPIYEEKFYPFSYGFRPGKSAHDAVEALWQSTMDLGGGYIIDLDISKFFDTLDHGKLREILKQRVSDGVLIRTIGKWLNAGVMEEDRLEYRERGTPQGGVISPLLSNIYLHEVLDRWFVEMVKPCLKGRAFIIRYADDAVIGCACEEDAERIMKVLPQRFAKYGLTVHPEKTRLVDFRKPGDDDQKGKDSFSFLGFRHYWMKSRKGKWVVSRKTDGKRLARSLKAIAEWCRRHRHDAVLDQLKALSQKLRGHYGYYGITFNSKGIQRFYRRVRAIWFKWLNRRSDKPSMYWWQYQRWSSHHPLAFPKVMHSAVRCESLS
jgi:group II intron reverse transcriptase/maturase